MGVRALARCPAGLPVSRWQSESSRQYHAGKQEKVEGIRQSTSWHEGGRRVESECRSAFGSAIYSATEQLEYGRLSTEQEETLSLK